MKKEKQKENILEKIVCRSSAIMVYSDLDEDLAKDEEIAKKCFTLNGYCLRSAPKKIRENVELVKLAISVDPGALLYASDKVKNDLEILQSTFKNYLTDAARLRLIAGHKVERFLKKKQEQESASGGDLVDILDSLILKENAEKEKVTLSQVLEHSNVQSNETKRVETKQVKRSL